MTTIISVFARRLRLIPGPWVAYAACADMPPDTFFLERGDSAGIVAAKQICAGCPVRAACLAYAIDAHENHGIWGGLSPRERLRARRAVAS